MADNTNKVTIDAAWFAELYEKANQSHNCDDCKEVHTRTHERDIAESKCKELAKERDELKAKLDGDATANGLSPATMKLLETEQRLAAAERCIEKIEDENKPKPHHDVLTMTAERTLNIIRAYRESKEAK